MGPYADHHDAADKLLGGDLRELLRQATRPVLVAVAGDSGSGKTTYTRGIERLLGNDLVTALSLDGYHKEDRNQRRQSGRSPLDPRANHLALAREHLAALRCGEAVEIPIYNHDTGLFDPPRIFRPAPVIIVEGLHALYPEFLPELDFKLYVETDREVKYRWKLERDVRTRGYDPDEARDELQRREAAYARWIDFQKTNADVIIRIHDSEMASLALDEYKGSVPGDCYHMEIIVTPTAVPLPSLYMPVDMNNMTQRQGMPFMLANVPSSYWGKPVNVVHVDGMMPANALRQLEAEIMRLAGIPQPRTRLVTEPDYPSTMLFTQLLIAWPFMGHLIALLKHQDTPRTTTRAGLYVDD
jgi:phosphoribulokinase